MQKLIELSMNITTKKKENKSGEKGGFRMETILNEETKKLEKVISNDITISGDELREAQSEILTVLQNHKFNYEVSELLLRCVTARLMKSKNYEQVKA